MSVIEYLLHEISKDFNVEYDILNFNCSDKTSCQMIILLEDRPVSSGTKHGKVGKTNNYSEMSALKSKSQQSAP